MKPTIKTINFIFKSLKKFRKCVNLKPKQQIKPDC